MHKTNQLPSPRDIALDDAQIIANRYKIPVVWCDHQATRRQRLHGVNLPDQTNTFSSTHLTEVLQHIDQAGYNDAIFISETPRRQHLACQIQFFPLQDQQ